MGDDGTTEVVEVEEVVEPVDGDTETEGAATPNLDELVSTIVEQVTARIEDTTIREVDRRINQATKTLDKKYGPKTEQPQEAEVASDPVLQRFLRSAVVETLNGEKWSSDDEKTAARSLALRLAQAHRVTDDDDEFAIAVEIVKEVRRVIDPLKATYEDQVLADLKRRGVISEDEGSRPAKKPNSTEPDPQREWDKGVERARRLRDKGNDTT